AKKAKGKESEQLFEHAVEHFQQQLRLAEQLEDKQNSLQKQNNAQSWLGRCYFKQAIIQKNGKDILNGKNGKYREIYLKLKKEI
ncbi:hypothetical protein NEISICOT_03088, partial [Neisseria sicca ATCC 29256]